MKLSTDTIAVLKNFAGINNNLIIKKGSVLKVMQPTKQIFGVAKVAEEFPVVVPLYDLGNFLGILSEYTDPVLEFPDDKHVVIQDASGRSKTSYRFASPEIMARTIQAPDKDINLPSEDFTFVLTESDFNWVLRMANVLQSPTIGVVSDGKNLKLVTHDLKRDDAPTQTLTVSKVPKGTPKFTVNFKTENWKQMPSEYTVTLSYSSKGAISRFVAKDKSLTYFLSIEKEASQWGEGE